MSVSVCRRGFACAVFALAVLACSFTPNLFASNVVVGPCKPPLVQFATIHDAITSVPAGSTINICPGTYAEQLTITKNLTLIGQSDNGLSGVNASGAANPTIVPPPSPGLTTNAQDLIDNSGIAAQIAVVTPAGKSSIKVNISNLTVDGVNNLISACSPDFVGIYYQNANGTIDHVTTRNQIPGSGLNGGLGGCQSGLAIYAQSGYTSGGTSTITIENNSVHDYAKNGITADGTGMTATISGNYVVGAGATPVVAQNGIQVSDGATGKVSANTVTDDVYVSPDGGPYYSATGILLYDSAGTSGTNLLVSGNTVSNAQGGIVAVGDGNYGNANYNNVKTNKVTTSPAAGPFMLDGIDLCSDANLAGSNVVFNSSGAGVHIDSECSGAGSGGISGNNTTVSANTVNEACAGVLLGNGTGSSQSGTIAYNVAQIALTGDSCPSNNTEAAKRLIKPRYSPLRR